MPVSPLTVLYANRTVRSFGYGLTSVLLGIYLLHLGAGTTGTLLALGLSLASGAALNAGVGYYGDRFGRRKAMMAFGLLMALSGTLLATAPTVAVALVGLALGAVSPSGTEVGPFLSLEQSIIAEVADPNRRTRAFATYNLLGSLAASVGAAASVPFTVTSVNPAATLASIRLAFVAFAGLGLTAAILSRALPERVELARPEQLIPLAVETRSRVRTLSSLFAVDSFAGGLVVQSFVALWFVTVYPQTAPYIGTVFFAAGLLTAFSFLLAARLGERIGLLETMVFTHIPSSVLLILVPLSPTLGGALAFYLARMSLSQMDVPTRQAYIAGIVAPSERTAANAWTNMSRNVAQAGGPFTASALVVLAGLASPFLLGGAMKIAYDVAVYRSFRKIRPDMA